MRKDGYTKKHGVTLCYDRDKHIFVIDKGDGRPMSLNPVEYSQLYQQVIRIAIWSEVEMRFPNDMDDEFDFDMSDVIRCKEDIIDDLLPDFLEISEDRVWQTLERFCDRIDPNEEAPY